MSGRGQQSWIERVRWRNVVRAAMLAGALLLVLITFSRGGSSQSDLPPDVGITAAPTPLPPKPKPRRNEPRRKQSRRTASRPAVRKHRRRIHHRRPSRPHRVVTLPAPAASAPAAAPPPPSNEFAP